MSSAIGPNERPNSNVEAVLASVRAHLSLPYVGHQDAPIVLIPREIAQSASRADLEAACERLRAAGWHEARVHPFSYADSTSAVQIELTRFRRA